MKHNPKFIVYPGDETILGVDLREIALISVEHMGGNILMKNGERIEVSRKIAKAIFDAWNQEV